MCSEAESGYWTVVKFPLDMDFWALVWRDFLVGWAIVDSGWSSVNFHIIFILISTSFGDNNMFFFDLEIETWVLKSKVWAETPKKCVAHCSRTAGYEKWYLLLLVSIALPHTTIRLGDTMDQRGCLPRESRGGTTLLTPITPRTLILSINPHWQHGSASFSVSRWIPSSRGVPFSKYPHRKRF